MLDGNDNTTTNGKIETAVKYRDDKPLDSKSVRPQTVENRTKKVFVLLENIYRRRI